MTDLPVATYFRTGGAAILGGQPAFLLAFIRETTKEPPRAENRIVLEA